MGKYYPNNYTICGDFARIELTNLRFEVKAHAIVDAEDVDRVLQVGRWHATKQGRTTYATSRRWPYTDSPSYLMHRVILNAPATRIIDHINGNGLDCRKSNLRFVDRQGNAQNLIGAHTDSKTGIRNVYPSSDTPGVYHVQVSVRGKRTSRSGFRSIEEAAAVASELRRQLQVCSPENSMGGAS